MVANSKRIDPTTDVANGAVNLVRFSKLYEFPEFVKRADVSTNLRVPEKTPITTCADQKNKMFWCHTKVATLLSHLYYGEQQAEFHPEERKEIETRLAKFAEYFGITEDCRKISEARTAREKVAEAEYADDTYAYVWVDDTGKKTRMLPMRSAAEVKAAAEYVEQYKSRIPFADRNKMAGRILQKAAEFSASLGPLHATLECQAGRGVGDTAEIVSMLQKRALAVSETTGAVYDDNRNVVDSARIQMRKLAECVAELPRQGMLPETMIKLAATVDTFDRMYDIVERYGTTHERPEDVIFRETLTKTASEQLQQASTTTGACYEKAALAGVPVSELSSLFGDEFADRVKSPLGRVDPEKLAEEMATLPRQDAQLLEHMLSENGITPMMRKAAGIGFSREAMERVAKTYGRTSS